MSPPRIPPLPGLLAFDTLARLRSVSLAGEALHITPSAVSHRMRQLESQLGFKLFERSDFTPTAAGAAYLVRVREALAALQQVPGRGTQLDRPRLHLAVTPTFSRELLMPRLALFRQSFPEVELVLQVAAPRLNATMQSADIELRFGTGPFTDCESLALMGDEVCPVCSPAHLQEVGPFDGFDTTEALKRARLIRSPLEPWRTWFDAHHLALKEPADGPQFNDLGLVLDAAVAGFGVALMRLKLGAAWLDSGRLLRLSPRSVASPHRYFLCWQPGALARWECAAFVDWLRDAIQP